MSWTRRLLLTCGIGGAVGLASCSSPPTEAFAPISTASAEPGRIDPFNLVANPARTHIAGRCGDITCIWDVESGTITAEYPHGGYPLEWPTDDALLCGGPEAMVRVIDPTSGIERLRLVGQSAIQHIDGDWNVGSATMGRTAFAVGTNDDTVRIWPRKGGNSTILISGIYRPTSLAFLDDDRLVVTSLRRNAEVWDIRTRQCITDLPDSPPQGCSVDVSPDGRTFATASQVGSRRVTLYSTSDLRPLRSISLGASDVSFNPASSAVAFSIPETMEVRIVGIANGDETVLTGHTDLPYRVLFLSENVAVSVSEQEGLLRWNTSVGTFTKPFQLPA